MKRLLTTTATALVLSTAAFAQETTAAFSDMTFDRASHLNASELIGMRVYATESDVDNDTRITDGGETEWDDIGEINEIVLTRDGQVQSLVVGVGGFLGMGEKDVAIDMSQLRFVLEEGDDDDFFLVINANAAAVEDAPAYERHADMTDGAKAEGQTGTDAAGTTMQNERTMLTPPMVERDGYVEYRADDLTTEDLTGARVYGADDEDVGEVSELLLTDDGKLDRAVIDVGGFLGMGEHSIAVTFDELRIVRSEDGSDLRVYIDSTQEALENQPEYEG